MTSKIIFCGCTESGLDVLNFLISKKIEISQIISLNSNQAIQYKVSGYASYSDVAKKFNIPLYYPKVYSLKNDQDLNFFSKFIKLNAIW